MSYHNTLMPLPVFVSQVFYNGMTLPGSGSPSKTWWWISGISFTFFILLLMADISDDVTYEECMEVALTNAAIDDCESRDFEETDEVYAMTGSLSCCCSLLTGIIALSVGGKKQTVMVQQMPQMYAPQPVVQQVFHQPVQSQMPMQQIPPVPTLPEVPPRSTTQSNQDFTQQAKNLEMARDFQGAADMYQKAGLFAEAGRVRQKFLEKDEKPVIQIGQVGNSVVQDSVITGSAVQSKVCQSCSAAMQPDWKFCPTCNTSI